MLSFLKESNVCRLTWYIYKTMPKFQDFRRAHRCQSPHLHVLRKCCNDLLKLPPSSHQQLPKISRHFMANFFWSESYIWMMNIWLGWRRERTPKIHVFRRDWTPHSKYVHCFGLNVRHNWGGQFTVKSMPLETVERHVGSRPTAHKISL